MSDSVFRELFVELGDATMAALQAMVEEAQWPKVNRFATPSRASLVLHMMPVLSERYGWRDAAVYRAAADPAIEFRVRFACGHFHRFRVGEDKLEAPSENAWIGDLVDTLDAIDGERSCTCIPEAA